jgi:hypothetical protein
VSSGPGILLDVDVTTGLGPETITMSRHPGERYLFYVHNYSANGKLPISQAELVVKLDTTYGDYTLPGGGSEFTMQVPSATTGAEKKEYWCCFWIDGGGMIHRFGKNEQGELTTNAPSLEANIPSEISSE